jgi:hypothetical protein
MAESILFSGWLAELNVDRLSLAGGLLGGRASEVEAKRKSTVAEALETWRARSEGEESRNRKVKAEAEASEDGRHAKGSPNRAFQPGRPKRSLFLSRF